MHHARRLIVLFVALAAVACTGDDPRPPASATGTPGLPAASATAFEVAQRYLQAWQERRYGDMYALLSEGSRQAIAEDRFVARYEGIADEATINSVAIEVSRAGDANAARIPFAVTFATALWGEVREQNNVPLSKGADGWRVEWSPALIFKDLSGANLVRTFIDAPKRGAIFDRTGKPLAITGSVPTVGTAKNLVNAKQIVPDREAFFRNLGAKIGMMPDQIRAKVDDPKIDEDLFIPLTTLPVNTAEATVAELENTPGVLVQQTPRRVYPNGTAAAHVIGYIAPITAEQLERLKGDGYSQADLVGAIGLEEAYEKELAGQRGARLTIITPEGGVLNELAKRPSRPSRDIVTTIDLTAQLAAEQALGNRSGAVVLIDPRDNGVVAMASRPTFDPNLFVTGLPAAEGQRLLNDPKRPFLNRALNATYPAGSTFKVITSAAGLERGGFTAQSRFPCPPTWYGLGPNFPKNNWSKVDEGQLSIAEGLMRSCNPVFYDIALKLDAIDPNILPQFSAAFGFGQPTGINGLADSAGVNPDPKWKQQQVGESWFTGDSVNMAIGQGFLLVTPIQVANAYSALARGQVLRSPVLVREQREAGNGTVIERSTAKERGRLPLSATTLQVIRDGVFRVTQDPRGTAYNVFRGSTIDPAGKSGTSEDFGQGPNSNAWFAAFAPRNDAKGVAVVLLDEGESGSQEAGPMTRQVLEAWLRVAG